MFMCTCVCMNTYACVCVCMCVCVRVCVFACIQRGRRERECGAWVGLGPKRNACLDHHLRLQLHSNFLFSEMLNKTYPSQINLS